jgi:hypothetical protein
LVKYEKRNTERYAVPGSRVEYKLEGGQSAETPVKDITHGGLCFEFEHSAEEGNLIEIEIRIPGREKLVLKGNIVWTSISSTDDPNYAAMQFLPFGTDERYNSMKYHERLKKLLKQCIEDNPPNIKFKL